LQIYLIRRINNICNLSKTLLKKILIIEDSKIVIILARKLEHTLRIKTKKIVKKSFTRRRTTITTMSSKILNRNCIIICIIKTTKQ